MIKGQKDYIFDTINYAIQGILLILILYPLYFIIISSISNPTEVATGNVLFMPKGFNMDAYKRVLNSSQIWIGFRNTIFYTAAGTLYNIVLTFMVAFPLSRKNLPGKKIITWYFLITMYIGGGLIPSYLLIKNLKMINTVWVMFIPSVFSVYNMIVVRTYMANSIPEELFDAARIDGCSQIKMFLKIAIPLSAPIIAVMALYYGVNHWNSWFSGMLYLNDKNKFPLQLIIRNVVISNQTLQVDMTKMTTEQMVEAAKLAHQAEAMKFSVIVITSLPLLCVFPFIQKYFEKGVMVGSVKG